MTCKGDTAGGKCKNCCELVDEELPNAQMCQTCSTGDDVVALCKNCRAPKQTSAVNEEFGKCKIRKGLADQLAAHLLDCAECKSADGSDELPPGSGEDKDKALELCGTCSTQKEPICPNRACRVCPLKVLCKTCQSWGDGASACKNCAKIAKLLDEIKDLKISKDCPECKEKDDIIGKIGDAKLPICGKCKSGGGGGDRGSVCKNCDDLARLRGEINDLKSKECEQCKIHEETIAKGCEQCKTTEMWGRTGICELCDRLKVCRSCSPCVECTGYKDHIIELDKQIVLLSVDCEKCKGFQERINGLREHNTIINEKLKVEKERADGLQAELDEWKAKKCAQCDLKDALIVQRGREIEKLKGVS